MLTSFLRTAISVCLCLCCLVSCRNDIKKVEKGLVKENAYLSIHGQTMGTTYTVKYLPIESIIEKEIIDSILVRLNQALSTYIDSSTISKINQSSKYGEKTTILLNQKPVTQHRVTLDTDPHFLANYKMAREVYYKTGGAFDPTVMPLVNYWGFGTTEKVAVSKIDSQKVKILKSYVGLDKVTFQEDGNLMTFIKPANLSLDFSALAKGYAVDYLSKYLFSRNIENHMVEIGGEVYCAGLSPSKQQWKIGINKPKIDAKLTDFSELVNLDKVGMASSGNYRIFHHLNGQLYGHEINPISGYPEINDLLGVSVIAPTTMEADAVATSLMILGLEQAKEFVENYQHLEAVFFSSDQSGKLVKEYSTGFNDYIHMKQSTE